MKHRQRDQEMLGVASLDDKDRSWSLLVAFVAQRLQQVLSSLTDSDFLVRS